MLSWAAFFEQTPCSDYTVAFLLTQGEKQHAVPAEAAAHAAGQVRPTAAEPADAARTALLLQGCGSWSGPPAWLPCTCVHQPHGF